MPTYAALNTVVASDPAVDSNVNFIAATQITVDGIELRSPSAGHLRLFKNSSNEYAINYNGESLSSLPASGTVTLPGSFRYAAINTPTAGAQITVSFTYSNSGSCTTACENSRIAIVDAAGNILASKVIYTQSPALDTISYTPSASTKLYVLFSRNGGSGGGLRIWSITK